MGRGGTTALTGATSCTVSARNRRITFTDYFNQWPAIVITAVTVLVVAIAITAIVVVIIKKQSVDNMITGSTLSTAGRHTPRRAHR